MLRHCYSRVFLAVAGATVAGTSLLAQTEIDLFMERVLERREENWITLHNYVLEERETLQVTGPDGATLQGFVHEYSWYVRDGYLIRSPVRFDGVEIGEDERRAFEAEWLQQERRRVDRPRRPRPRRSRRGPYENVMLTIERDWGGRISEPLGRRLADDAERRDDDFAAVVMGADAILADLGGVDIVGFGVVVERTRDAFVMLETKRLEDAEVADLLAVVLPRLSASLPDSTGRAVETDIDRFVELAELAARFGLRGSRLEAALETAEAALRGRGLADHAAVVAAARVSSGPPRGSGDGDEPLPTTPPAGGLPSASLQPRFVSEAYFLDFQFESGTYYFVGRDEIDGRDVVVVEYYPEQLFSEADATVASNDREDRIEAGFDKTSLVTLWIDPELYQIVKFTFDNVGFDFLPGRWLLRLDDLTASMVMSQPFDGIWLPRSIDLRGQISLAVGRFSVVYEREFFDYRQAEVRARIRSYRLIDSEPR